LRRASAARRHAVWALSLLALCVLPIVSALPPGWRAPVVPRWLGDPMAHSPHQPQISDAFRIQVDPEQVLRGGSGLVVAPGSIAPSGAKDHAAESARIATWALIVWAAGASIALARLIASLVGLWRTGRRAVPLTHSASIALAERWMKDYGISRKISF